MLKEWFRSIVPFLSEDEMDILNKLENGAFFFPEIYSFPIKGWLFVFHYEMVKKYHTLSPRYVRK